MKKILYFGFLITFLFLSLVNAEAFFDDVDEYRDAIIKLNQDGIINGYEDNTFRPQNTINRAELLKILIKVTVDEDINEEDFNNCFSDVGNQWFAKYICYAKDHNIVNGYEDGTFKPDQSISFVEAAKIISITFNLNLNEEGTGYVWFRQYAKALEVKNAIPQSIWDIDQKITRADAAEMIYRIKYNINTEINHSYEFLIGLNHANLAEYYTYDKYQNVYVRDSKICADFASFEVLGDKYAKDKDNIFYGTEKLPADRDSFEFVKISNNGEGIYYAKDKNNLYYKGLVLKNVDFDKIQVLSDYYVKYKDDIYCLNDARYSVSFKFPDEDFTVLERGYAKDKNNVYRVCSALQGRDPESFKVLDKPFTKDKNHIYNDLYGLISNIDAKSFELLDDYCARDKDKIIVFFRDKLHWHDIENVDLESFEILNGFYAKDKNHVYYYGYSVLENADPMTFEVLDEDYAKDKNNIYYLDVVLNDVDLESFEIIDEDYSKDKNHFYVSGRLTNIDLETFEILNQYYVKDKNHVFINFINTLIKIDVDVQSFQVFDNSPYAKDEAYCYYNSKTGGNNVNIPIADCDPATFELLAGNYAKDKNYVYIDGKVLHDANPATFELLAGNYARDNNYVFKNNTAYSRDRYYLNLSPINKVCNPQEGKYVNLDDIRDSEYIYLRPSLFDDSDPEHIYLSPFFLKDNNNNLFYNRTDSAKFLIKEVRGAQLDIKTLTINGDYFRDKDNVYVCNIGPSIDSHRLDCDILEGLKPGDIRAISELPAYSNCGSDVNSYIRKDDTIYIIESLYCENGQREYKVRTIGEADAQTFQILEKHPEYGLDSEHVFYNGFLMQDADAKTFDVINRAINGGVYRMTFDADPKSSEEPDYFYVTDFEFIGSTGYSKDQNYIYYMEEKIPNADPESFEILLDTTKEADAKDENYYFYKGQQVEAPSNS